MIGLLTTYMQEYLSAFIRASTLMSKHYEPPVNTTQAITWARETLNLESFRQGAKNRRQVMLYGAFFDIGLKVASYRQWNSGWQNYSGGFEHAFLRKVPTALMAFITVAPFGVAGEMVQRAYTADATFPKELQKGYTSYFNAFRRIPFEEGPYYLFKNTFPLYFKHIIGPFTAFYSHDWLKDKVSVLWRTGSAPMYPFVVITTAFSAYLAAAFTYPFAYTSKAMIDLWPKKDGVDPWHGNYRKAITWMWYGPTWNLAFPGFFRHYFWHVFPLWFTSLLLADKMGMFSYWRIDLMAGAGDNTSDDSFI